MFTILNHTEERIIIQKGWKVLSYFHSEMFSSQSTSANLSPSHTVPIFRPVLPSKCKIRGSSVELKVLHFEIVEELHGWAPDLSTILWIDPDELLIVSLYYQCVMNYFSSYCTIIPTINWKTISPSYQFKFVKLKPSLPNSS